MSLHRCIAMHLKISFDAEELNLKSICVVSPDSGDEKPSTINSQSPVEPSRW